MLVVDSAFVIINTVEIRKRDASFINDDDDDNIAMLDGGMTDIGEGSDSRPERRKRAFAPKVKTGCKTYSSPRLRENTRTENLTL